MRLKPVVLHTIDQHSKALSNYLPGGKLWTAKNIENSTIRNLLIGVSREILRAEGYMKALQDEFIPDLTDNLIPEWERALGIPDDCFTGQGTNDIRRRDILIKLASLGVQTQQDFIDLAALFGITVNVLSGSEASGPATMFPLTFPITFLTDSIENRFTIVVEFLAADVAPTFPLTFPFTFGLEVVGLLQCLFNKLKPANCQVIFTEV